MIFSQLHFLCCFFLSDFIFNHTHLNYWKKYLFCNVIYVFSHLHANSLVSHWTIFQLLTLSFFGKPFKHRYLLFSCNFLPLHALYFTQTLMEHTLGRHSLIFFWWHTRIWSRRSRRSNTPQESSASNFTRSHDRVVLSAEAPFYLGFRESTVARKCCGQKMYQFASLGLAVNWWNCIRFLILCYSVTLWPIVSPTTLSR